MSAQPILPAVAVALALEGLDKLKALERLPSPEALLEHLQTRNAEFDLLAGVAGAYLHTRGLIGGCNE